MVRARRPGRAGRHDPGGAAPPDGARQRLPAEKVDAALGNYFRTGNLTALRELALLWLADKVEDALQRYRADHGIDGTWETRERVVVALTGGPEGDTLIRRAARIAARGAGGDLLAVHVARTRRPGRRRPGRWPGSGSWSRASAARYHQVVGADVAAALLDFARGVNATQIVLGASRRGRLARLLGAGVGATAIRESGVIDVHLVTHEQAGAGRRLPGSPAAWPARRRLAGFARRRRRAAAADRCCWRPARPARR